MDSSLPSLPCGYETTVPPHHCNADLLERAAAAAEDGNVEMAIPLFQAAVAQLPAAHSSLPAAYEMLAQCFMEQGGHEGEALNAAEAASQLAPAWPVALLTLGRAALGCGHLKQAVAAFNACMELPSLDADVAVAVAAEVAEAEGLLELEAGHRIGLPGLRIREVQGQGPGGVVWDAGILLAWWLVQQQQHEGSEAAAEETEAPNKHHQQQQVARPEQAMISLAGTRVLELGSGSGIAGAGCCVEHHMCCCCYSTASFLYAGITAACLGAQVVATDLPATLPVLMANIHRNRALIAASGGSIEAVPLDWVSVGMGARACAGDREPSMGSTGVSGAAAGEEEVPGSSAPPHPTLAAGEEEVPASSAPPHPTLAAVSVPLQQFDWVIGSDLVYSAEPVAPLVNVFAVLRAREGGVEALGVPVPRVLISHKHRHVAVDAALLSGLEDVGFRLVEVLRDDGSGVSVYVTPAD